MLPLAAAGADRAHAEPGSAPICSPRCSGSGLPRHWQLALGVLMLVATQRGPWLAPLGMALGAWLIFGSLAELAQRIALFSAPLATSLSRLVGLPRSSLGMTSAHAGLGLMIIGIIAITLWKVEHIVAMKPGERADVGDYTVHVPGRNAAHRRKLHGPRRAVPDFPGRARNRHRRLREARIQAHGHADHRSGPASNAGRRCLCGDGRQDRPMAHGSCGSISIRWCR